MLQELFASNHQRKKLLKVLNDEQVMIEEENGDIVINVKAYREFVQSTGNDPVKTILGIHKIAKDVEYIVVQ